MEKFCPACSRAYTSDIDHCEVDGERLVVLSHDPQLAGHVLDGKYRLLSQLGEGGMGSVYLAEQSTMGREVAVKVLRRDFSQNRTAIKRFLREARAASKLDHPNTITVYDFGQSDDGLLYLVMERLTGQALADMLDNSGALPLDIAVSIIGQICDSLSEAHEHGITHRDLKPENIFIEKKAGNDHFVKVLDFGIAKMQDEDQSMQATAAGMVCGTPAYMSPEQALGQEIDGRTDIYALGILLFELLTNHRPFDGDTPMEVMIQQIKKEPPTVFEATQIRIPDEIQDVIDLLLSKNKDERPATCQEVKSLLFEAYEASLNAPALAIPTASEPKASKPKHSTDVDAVPYFAETGEDAPATRRRGFAWVLVALLLLGGGLAFWLAPPSSDAASKPATKATSAGTEPVALNPDTPNKGVASPPSETAALDAQPAETDAPDTPTLGAANNDIPEAQEMSRDMAQDDIAGAEQGEGEGEALDEPEAPPAPTTVSLQIESHPEGAFVYEGDTLLGITPYTMTRERQDAELVFELRRKGYESQVLNLNTSQDLKTLIHLREDPPKAVAPPPRRNTPSRPRTPRRTESGFGGTF